MSRHKIKSIVHKKLLKDRDLDIGGDQKLETSTLGEIVSLEKSNKNYCHCNGLKPKRIQADPRQKALGGPTTQRSINIPSPHLERVLVGYFASLCVCETFHSSLCFVYSVCGFGCLVIRFVVFGYLGIRILKLTTVISDEDQELLLLISLPSSYDNFVETLLYGQDTLKLEDMLATLDYRELQKMTKAKVDGGEGLYVRGRSGQRDMGHGINSTWSKLQERSGILMCYICQSGQHLKRGCPRYNHKKSQGFVRNKDQVSGSGVDGYDNVDVMMAMKVFTVKMQSGKIKVIKGSLMALSGTRRANCAYTLDGHAVTRKTLKGRKQLGEYQTGWKIKTGNILDFCNQMSTQQCTKSGVAKHLGVAVIQQQNGLVKETNVTLLAKGYHRGIVCNKALEVRRRYFKGTGSMQLLHGFEFEVELLGDHTFKVKPQENVDQGVGLQEVQTQDLIYYHLARDREKHSTHELFSYREDNNEAAFAVDAVKKIYAHDLLTFNDTVASTVAGKAMTTTKAITGSIHQGLLDKAKGNVLGMQIVRDQSGNTLRVSQSRFYNGKLVQTLLEGHSILSLEGSLSRDCDFEKRMTDVQVFVDFDYAMGRLITVMSRSITGGCKGGYLAKWTRNIVKILTKDSSGYCYRISMNISQIYRGLNVTLVLVLVQHELRRLIIDGKDEKITFKDFPDHLSERTKLLLTNVAFVHLKHLDVSKHTQNLSPASRSILLSGPAEFYHQKLAKALSHEFETKLLMLDIVDFSAKIRKKYGAGTLASPNAVSSYPFNELVFLQELHKVLVSFSKTNGIILYIKDVNRFLKSPRTYELFDMLLKILSGSTLVLGSGISTRGKGNENISCLFPYKIVIKPPEDKSHLKHWNEQLEEQKKIIQIRDTKNHIAEVLEAHKLECNELGSICQADRMLISTYMQEIVVLPDNEYEKRIRQEVIPAKDITVTFGNIGALNEIKESLQELVMLPLKRPDLFNGGLLKPCRGVLLFGPPGTGKTMLAKAIAKEAGASFINISVSTITSKWHGEDEKNVRAVFSLATKVSPTIIFLDEVDSMLGQRTRGEHLSWKLKNEFMTHWDGLLTKPGERIIVLAATNRPFDLDEAIIRRFERRIMVGLPSVESRESILKTLLGNVKVENLEFKELAVMTEGYSGSDLKDTMKNEETQASDKKKSEETQTSEKKKSEEKQATGDAKDTKEENQNVIKLRHLNMEDMRHAKNQVAASLDEGYVGSIMSELKDWNDKYGEGGSRKKEQLSYFL
nr:P-loop containing nucleoside triphosphate hydrolases superfamily protein [Tanacetum cinerariifolium]